MRILGLFLSFGGITGLLLIVILGFSTNAEYARDIRWHWTLGDRASTIEAKAEHLEKFYATVVEHRRDFADYSAPIYHTPENSVDRNLEALKTLVDRLQQIRTLDQSTFQYQTAIQQITAQEQGEAEYMMNVFMEAWFLGKYPLLYTWWCLLMVLVLLKVVIVGYYLTFN